jgi:hypothetical protein
MQADDLKPSLCKPYFPLLAVAKIVDYFGNKKAGK